MSCERDSETLEVVTVKNKRKPKPARSLTDKQVMSGPCSPGICSGVISLAVQVLRFQLHRSVGFKYQCKSIV